MDIALRPWLLPTLRFFPLDLSPGDSVGFPCLLNLSLLIPEVLFRDTRQDALVPAALFFSDPEHKLGGPLFLTAGKHGDIVIQYQPSSTW